MLETEIIEVDEYANYVLEDKYKNKYVININFMDMNKPKVGTILFIPKSVINEKVSLNYGLSEENEIKEDNEYIVMICDGEKKYLKRFYG